MDLACRRKIPTLWDGFSRASGLANWFPRSRLFAGYNLTFLDEDDSYDVGAINGAFMMGKRKAFDEVGLFDEEFFMYGDDLDLCYRFTRAGYRVVYDGRVSITHLKGISVAKDYDRMSRAIFDANKTFFLKHFNREGRWMVRLKYDLAFGAWKWVARFRNRVRGHRGVRPR
jgi:GT2 family glycosyltransferase